MNPLPSLAKILVPLIVVVGGCTVVTNPAPANPEPAQPPPPPATVQPAPPPPAETTPPAQTTPPPNPTTVPRLRPPPTSPPPRTTPPSIIGRFRVSKAPPPTVGEANLFGGPTKNSGSLEGYVFLVDRQTKTIPDLTHASPIAKLYTDALDIPSQDFKAGFSPMSGRFEYFVIHYEGAFSVTLPGSYEFKLVSDDGARLTIDNAPVINNDGIHVATEKTGTINLAPGAHTIAVDYFQAQGKVALQLFVTLPSGQQRLWGPSL